VKEWITEEFPRAVEDVAETDPWEIFSLTQGRDEALAAYYQRTVGLLRRTHGRDKPRDETIIPLSGLEAVMLNCLVYAFVKGLSDGELCLTSIDRDAATCGALWKSYEIVQSTQRSLARQKQVEDSIAKSKKLAELEEWAYNHHGRPAHLDHR